MQNNKNCLYLCEALKGGNRKERYQAIFYPNGRILVGYDAWRILNSIDTASYPLFWYPHFSDFYAEFDIVGVRDKNNLEQVRAALIPHENKKKKEESRNGRITRKYGCRVS